MWYVSTNTYEVSENKFFRTRTPIISLLSAFFFKKISIFLKNSTFTQGNSLGAVLKIF